MAHPKSASYTQGNGRPVLSRAEVCEPYPLRKQIWLDAVLQSLKAWRRVLTVRSNPLADSYRVALICPATKRILAARARNTFYLPRLAIPRWTRAAREIQRAIERAWPFEVVVTDILDHSEGIDDLAVVELRRGCTSPHIGAFQFTSIDKIANQEISDQERRLLRRLVATGSTGRGPFSCFGWADKVIEWTAERVGATSADFASAVRQFNAGPSTVLVRLDHKSGKPYWFKASGSAEFHVTEALAEWAPGCLPIMLGEIPSSHAWLTEDAGRELNGLVSSSVLERVAIRLAELQRKTECHCGELLRMGCDDQRPLALLGKIPMMVDRLKEVMATPGASPLKHVDSRRLDAIGAVLSDACLRLDEIAVPHALVHNDIRAENILVRNGQCVFIDWAEAAVGCPFVALENLCTQLAQLDTPRSWLRRMTKAYKSLWRGELTGEQMNLAFQVTPMLALVCCAWSRSEWLTGARKDLPESKAQARALARLLDRTAERLEPVIKNPRQTISFCCRTNL